MKIGEKFTQIKELEGFKEFNYIGEIFEITDINENVAIMKCFNVGVGCGCTEGELELYFKPYIYDTNSRKLLDDGTQLIFNNKVVIAILKDGNKGVAKCLEEDIYDKEKGIEIAITKAKIKQLNKKLKMLVK